MKSFECSSLSKIFLKQPFLPGFDSSAPHLQLLLGSIRKTVIFFRGSNHSQLQAKSMGDAVSSVPWKHMLLSASVLLDFYPVRKTLAEVGGVMSTPHLLDARQCWLEQAEKQNVDCDKFWLTTAFLRGKEILLFCYLWKHLNSYVIYQLCFRHTKVSRRNWKGHIF